MVGKKGILRNIPSLLNFQLMKLPVTRDCKTIPSLEV